MYWNVPTIVPSAVSGRLMVGDWVRSPGAAESPDPPGACVARASPKSMSFAPLLVSMMFAGLRSRWTMPLRCARSSASEISMA